MAILRPLACLAAIAVALVAPALAAPKSPDAAMMAPINTVAKAINSGNASAMTGSFADGAVIIDEFPPYLWKAPNAGLTWLNDFSAYAKTLKITQAHATLSPAKNFDISSNAAYIVVPTKFTGMMKGKPFGETGLWTFVLTKRATKWLIASESWSTQSMSM